MVHLRVYVAIALLVMTAGTSVQSQGLFQQFMQAWQIKDYQDCVRTGKMLTTRVDHPDLIIQLAECHCGLGEYAEARALISNLSHRGLIYDMDSISSSPLATIIRQILSEGLQPFTYFSDQAKKLTLSDSVFIPEGIAFDKQTLLFYLGSFNANKIISADLKGRQKDFFIPAGRVNWSFTGIKIYEDELWACAFSEHGSNQGQAAVFHINLRTGKLINQFIQKTGEHLFNDLVKSKSGELYVTDSKSGFVYRLTNKTFHPIADSAAFIYPNGIAVDDLRNKLYVAHWGGIQVIDLKSERVEVLSGTGKPYLNSIDGLYWKQGKLIAVQNLRFISRIISINFRENNVSSVTELCRNKDSAGIPTTGVIVGNNFHFISNSFLRQVKPDGSIDSVVTMQPCEIRTAVIPDN